MSPCNGSCVPNDHLEFHVLNIVKMFLLRNTETIFTTGDQTVHYYMPAHRSRQACPFLPYLGQQNDGFETDFRKSKHASSSYTCFILTSSSLSLTRCITPVLVIIAFGNKNNKLNPLLVGPCDNRDEAHTHGRFSEEVFALKR